MSRFSRFLISLYSLYSRLFVFSCFPTTDQNWIVSERVCGGFCCHDRCCDSCGAAFYYRHNRVHNSDWTSFSRVSSDWPFASTEQIFRIRQSRLSQAAEEFDLINQMWDDHCDLDRCPYNR